MSLLSLGAAALISNAEAGEMPYDVGGGQAFEISVTGHKVIKNGVAYLALTEVADQNFRTDLLALMGEGNTLNVTDNKQTVLFRLGCADVNGIQNENLSMAANDMAAYWASSSKSPIQVVLGFKKELGTDGMCASHADTFRVTSGKVE